MNARKFDDLVAARADERVQAKIMKVKNGVADLLRSADVPYVGDPRYSARFGEKGSEAMKIISILASDNHRQDWPASLWERERAKVQKELLDTMQEMEKALISVGRVKGEDESTSSVPEDQP